MNHRHKAKTLRTVGYSGSVAWPENRRAHGAVCHIETCLCGATRRTNSNGRHEEVGRWEAPEPAERDRTDCWPGGGAGDDD